MKIDRTFDNESPPRPLAPSPCLRAAVLSALVLFIATDARANQQSVADLQPPDKVTLKREGRRGHVVLTGRILDYTAKKIKLRLTNGLVRLYSSSWVIGVQTPQTEAHIKGQAAFSNKRYVVAKAAFLEALKTEKRAWVRRELSAWLIRCSLIQGDYRSAGARFKQLVESERHTRFFKLIPLVWSDDIVDARLRSAAVAWLKAPSPSVQLMGAAALLTDKQFHTKAEKVLDQLAVNADRRVNKLAVAQRWRLHLAKGTVHDVLTDHWESRIEAMPEEFRGGPYYLLGRAYLLQQEYEKAAMALLHLPMVYSDDHRLAARAALESAEALAGIGRTNEATTLYREVVLRFGDTPSSARAAEALKALTGNPAPIRLKPNSQSKLPKR